MGGLRRCPDCIPGSLVDCGIQKRRRGEFDPLRRTTGSKTIPLYAALEMEFERLLREINESRPGSEDEGSEASTIGCESSETMEGNTDSSDRFEHDFQVPSEEVEDKGIADEQSGDEVMGKGMVEDEMVEDGSVEGGVVEDGSLEDGVAANQDVSDEVVLDNCVDEIPGNIHMNDEVVKNKVKSHKVERYVNMEEFVSEEKRTLESIQDFRQFLSEVGFDRDDCYELPSIEGLNQNWLEMNNDLEYFDWNESSQIVTSEQYINRPRW